MVGMLVGLTGVGGGSLMTPLLVLLFTGLYLFVLPYASKRRRGGGPVSG